MEPSREPTEQQDRDYEAQLVQDRLDARQAENAAQVAYNNQAAKMGLPQRIPVSGQQSTAQPDPLEQQARQNIDRMQQIARDVAPERQRAAEALSQQQQQLAQDIAGTEIPGPPGRPKPIPVPTREQSIDQTAAKSLFAVASVIGALGMIGGRGRGMLAMSGMTGAINGFQEGNREKFEAGLKTYDREVQQQLDEYHMAHQEYLDTINNTKLGWQQRMLSLQLQAKAFEDPIMARMAEFGDLGEVTKYIDEFEKNRINLQRVSKEGLSALRPTQGEYGMLLELRKAGRPTGNPLVDSLTPAMAAERLQKGVDPFAFTQARPGEAAPQGPITETGIPQGQEPINTDPKNKNESVLQGLRPEFANQVRQLTDYRLPTPPGGFGSQQGRILVSYGNSYDRTFDVQQYPSRQRMINDYSSPQGTAGLQKLRMNTAIDHLAQLNKATQELDNYQIPLLNQLILGARERTGDPRVDKFAVPAQAVAAEIAGVLKGTRAAPTEQEIGEQRKIISAAKSPAQLKTIIQSSANILQPRAQELERMWTDQFGSPPKAPIISPQRRTDLQSIGVNPDTFSSGMSGRGGAGQGLYPDGTIISNPRTGQRMIKKGGQWQPLNQ